MYIVNGIAYAGERKPELKVCGIRPMNDFLLWVRFNTGEVKVFDFKPLLQTPAFEPLADRDRFREVYLDYGVPVWQDGDIDISPNYLYEHAVVQQTGQAS